MESKALLVSALWYEGTYMYCQPRLWVCGRDDLLCADMTPYVIMVQYVTLQHTAF